MMPPLPVSWGASLASMSGSPATTELLTTRPSASVVVRRAPGGTDALGQLTSLMCWLVTVSARPRLVAATTICSDWSLRARATWLTTRYTSRLARRPITEAQRRSSKNRRRMFVPTFLFAPHDGGLGQDQGGARSAQHWEEELRDGDDIDRDWRRDERGRYAPAQRGRGRRRGGAGDADAARSRG